MSDNVLNYLFNDEEHEDVKNWIHNQTEIKDCDSEDIIIDCILYCFAIDANLSNNIEHENAKTVKAKFDEILNVVKFASKKETLSHK